MLEVLKISLDRKKQVVEIDGATYEVREMDGLDLGKWRTQMGNRVRFSASGALSGIQDFAGIEASLICRCLYNAKGELVGQAVIEKWPVSAQQALFKVCSELNGLTDETEAKEKKS